MKSKGYTYIIKCNDGSYYTGATSNIQSRLSKHFDGKVKYTKSRMPLKPVFVKEFISYKEARNFESKIKSWKKRKLIKKMLNKPDNVVEKYI